tara:strand:+ start:150 stop:314 length:165 start_codon:yes stop_codon:yes gene_type:complete
MYKLKYRTYGILEEVTSKNIEPLQQLLRNLFALHNNYKGSTENFELVFFGEVAE